MKVVLASCLSLAACYGAAPPKPPQIPLPPPDPNAEILVHSVTKTTIENVDKQDGYHLMERSYGPFARRFTLPSTVETGNVTAQSRDGVLRALRLFRAKLDR